MGLGVFCDETGDSGQLASRPKMRDLERTSAGNVIAVAVRMSTETRLDERRDTAMREALLNRLRSEIRHVPGLALTPDQASRLFQVPPDVCVRLLTSLAKQGVIQMRPDGRFVAVGLSEQPKQ